MADDGWMNRILDDARDRALREGRAKQAAQQLEITAARARIDDLTERCETLEAAYLDARAELLAAYEVVDEFTTQERVLTARFSMLLRRLLGEPGILALIELIEPFDLALWLASPIEQRLIAALEQPRVTHAPTRG